MPHFPYYSAVKGESFAREILVVAVGYLSYESQMHLCRAVIRRKLWGLKLLLGCGLRCYDLHLIELLKRFFTRVP